MKIIGKTTIHPLWFYSGKISGYIVWVILFLSILGFRNINQPYLIIRIISYLLTGVGLLFAAISLINLGKSTRLGLPEDKTEFIQRGLYRLSRNPMYLGFNLLTLAGMLVSWNYVIAIVGFYSILVYDFIIQGEEEFLQKEFGKKFLAYKSRVRKYI